MDFALSEEQKRRLSVWRGTLDSKENLEWYSTVGQASKEFNEILLEAKLSEGGNLTSSQFDRLFKLMKALSHNRALSRLLYEANGLQEFNRRLRELFFGSEPIAKRIDQFRDLKGIKEVTMSHFLCLKDFEQYPYVTPETFEMLEIESPQDEAAKSQALREHNIRNTQEYHGTTIEYLKDWVIFRAVKEELSLQSYPQVNVILWDAYASRGEKEQPRRQTNQREKGLYDPIAARLKETRGSGKEYFWVKVTAYQNRRGQWSRPDITSIEVDWFDNLPQKYVQVTSYEVKKRGSYDLSSVYEAAAHQRYAHKTFLVIEVESNEESIEDDVEREAARLGVGVMKAYPRGVVDQIDLETVVDPALKNPELEDLNELIEDYFEDDKEGLRRYRHAIGK